MSSHSDAPTNQSKSLECPPEQEPLAEDIQASCNSRPKERGNKNKSESISEHPFSLFSLNCTEMDNEGDEANSVGQSSSMDTVEVEGYQVRPELESIVRKFLIKHGNVFENCTVSTMIFRSMLLEMICEIISDLQDKDLYEITEDKLHTMIGLANDMKDMKVNIEWLHLRLEEILEARQSLNQSTKLKEKKHISKKIVETVKRELDECEEKKNSVAARFRLLCDKETACKESLARAEDEYAKISQTLTDATSKVRQFANCSLADGLL